MLLNPDAPGNNPTVEFFDRYTKLLEEQLKYYQQQFNRKEKKKVEEIYYQFLVGKSELLAGLK